MTIIDIDSIKPKRKLTAREYLYVYGDMLSANKRRKLRTQALANAAVKLRPYFRAAQLAHKWVSGYRARKSAGRLVLRPRNSTRTKNRKKKYQRVKANVAGTTYTTSRQIVRKTPREQRFLRKLFREGESNQVKYVQRFGFSFIGASENNKAIWYSITHLKFNNIVDFFKDRPTDPTQNRGSNDLPNNQKLGLLSDGYKLANMPSQFIYLGKCTFNYELYNPTNYNMTVYIYDLICKHDTPRPIKYGNTQTVTTSCSPECCMEQSTYALSNNAPNGSFTIADPTNERPNQDNNVHTDPDWRMVGMKPTDYFYFNAMWKVKGVKKIILPPASCHHHVVIFNPKKKVTSGTLFYRNQNKLTTDQIGLGGITQSTLFGIEGQVATDAMQTTDNNVVGTLPPKLVIKCIRKCNVWNFAMKTQTIIQKNQLMHLDTPSIFTDLIEQPPSQV